MDVEEEEDNMNPSSFSSISNEEDVNETSPQIRLSPLRMSPIISSMLVISDDESSMSEFPVQPMHLHSSSMHLHSPLFGFSSSLDDEIPSTSGISGIRRVRRQSTSAPLRSYFSDEANDSSREQITWDDGEEEIIQESDQQINLPESPINPAPPEPETDDVISDDGENDGENWSNSIGTHLRRSSSQLFDTQHGESLDSEEHLFAPDEASELEQNPSPSSSNPPAGLVSILRSMPSTSSYQYNNSNEATGSGSGSAQQLQPPPSRFNYMNTSGIIPITSRYSVLRTGNRLLPRSTLRNRFSSSPFRLASETNSPGTVDSPLNLTQRRFVSNYRSRLLNLRNRTRSTYEHLFLRNRLHNCNALEDNSNSVSVNVNGSETNDDLPPRLRRRRRIFSDDFEVDSLNGNNTSIPYRPSLRLNRSNSIEQRTSSFLRRILDLNNQLDTTRASNSLPPLTVNCGRARSVSPIPAPPWISNSVDDDSLDDTSVDVRDHSRERLSRLSARAELINFVQDSQDVQIERPNTPLPPPITDDESPSTPTPSSTNNDASLFDAVPFSITVSSSANANRTDTGPSAAARAARDLKEIPQTYEGLNYELIQLLECPICFEYSTPPINQCLQGHIICTNCRQRVNSCPTCRNMFQESRNLIMEKVAALLRYPCKNAITGCLETLFLLQKEQHEQSCGFRHYVCFIPMCNWRGYKPELLVHVQEAHENHVIHGTSVNLLIPITGQTKKVWLMSAFNELFYVIFFATLGILKGCVRFIGDSSKSENYTYTISVTSEEEMLRNLNYTRTTHAYEENAENIDILDSYDLFSISYPSLSTFRRGTRAPVRVTVEEARPRNAT